MKPERRTDAGLVLCGCAAGVGGIGFPAISLSCLAFALFVVGLTLIVTAR